MVRPLASNPPSTSDAELLRRYARHRDDAAFGRLVARHLRAVRRVAFSYTRHAHAAEDVAQAAFLVMAGRPLPALRSAKRRRSALPWLAKTCRFAAANWRRAESRRHRRERAAARPAASYDPTAARDLAEAVASALACLPRRERRIVSLRHLSQMSWDEVARHSGTTPDAARVAATRALAQLRTVLERRGITAGAAAVVAGLHALAAPAPAAPTPLPAATAAELARSVLAMLKLETAAVAAASLLISGGLAATAAAFLLQEPSAATRPVPPVASATPPATRPATAPAPFAVDLGAGGRLEILALAEHKPGGRVWSADGRPLARRPVELPAFAPQDGLIELWFRLADGDGDAPESFLSVTTSPLPPEMNWKDSFIWEQEVYRTMPPSQVGEREAPDGAKLHDAMVEMSKSGTQMTLVRPTAGAATIGLVVAAPVEDWQVLQTWGGAMQGFQDRADWVAGGMVGYSQGPKPDDFGLETRCFARGLPTWSTRVQVALRDGRVRELGSMNEINFGEMKTRELKVDGIEHGGFDQFRLLGRPNATVSVRGLAARPGVAAEPAAAVGKGEPLPWEKPDVAR